jgi:hypothetical protein
MNIHICQFGCHLSTKITQDSTWLNKIWYARWILLMFKHENHNLSSRLKSTGPTLG